jgi:SAM-dependent methyltransferase
MSHYPQTAFVNACALIIATVCPYPSVLEVGSYDVNGSVRPLFHYAREYIGVDLISGPSVDIVAHGHEFGISNTYDVVLSCEAFEHNPFWMETFINMIRVCRPGGIVLFTCASTGRLEHGTARTSIDKSPGTSARGWNYYRNLTRRDFLRCHNLSSHFIDFEFFGVKSSHDLYFIGVKRDPKRQDLQEHNLISKYRDELRTSVNALKASNDASSFAAIVFCTPLRAVSAFLPDKYYQSFACLYLRSLAPLIRFRRRWPSCSA